MILNDILACLNADSILQGYINGHITPYSADVATVPCVVYSLTPINDNKVTRQDRLEIHIISKDMALMYAIDARIRTLLLSYGDDSPLPTVLQAEVNGGGTLVSDGILHQFIYISILSRSE